MKDYFLAILKPTTAELESLLCKNLIDLNTPDPVKKRTLNIFLPFKNNLRIISRFL